MKVNYDTNSSPDDVSSRPRVNTLHAAYKLKLKETVLFLQNNEQARTQLCEVPETPEMEKKRQVMTHV
jgi:hypothetical protein